MNRFLSTNRKLLLTIAIQSILWVIIYFFWMDDSYFRFNSNNQREFYTFWIVFVATNIHNWILFRIFYERGEIRWYIIITLLLVAFSTVAEYYCVIDVISTYVSEEYLLRHKIDTLVGVFIRLVTLFSFSSFVYLYRDAIRYKEYQKEKINNLERMEELQQESINYFAHEHFTENAFTQILSHLPKDAENIKLLIENLFKIYKYSFSKLSCFWSSISDEIEITKTLINYYQLRYPLLKINLEIKGEILPYSIPPLIFEPIISNMFKHGYTDQNGEASVYIEFSEAGILTVICKNKWDYKKPLFTNRNMRGLDILRKKIELSYEEGYASLDLDYDKEYFIAKLTIEP
jgi:hypothetical protein